MSTPSLFDPPSCIRPGPSGPQAKGPGRAQRLDRHQFLEVRRLDRADLHARRYYTRGRFSQARFTSSCLAEYAETFPVVCGDFSFYQFPSAAYWQKLFHSAPADLLYAFKVPEEVTVKTFPRHPRYGARAGEGNPSFLDAALFQDAFLGPLEAYRRQVARDDLRVRHVLPRRLQ